MAERLTKRGERGRYLKGNPPGPGNPFAAQVAKYRKHMFSVITDEDIEKITRSLISFASAGDVAAIKLVLQYCCGAPPGELGQTLNAMQIIVQVPGWTPSEGE